MSREPISTAGAPEAMGPHSRAGGSTGAGDISLETQRVIQLPVIDLTDRQSSALVDEVHASYFAGAAPARATVQRDAQLEIDTVAIAD